MTSRKPKKERIRELRDEALEYLRKGGHAAALVRFAELERLAPDVPEFPQRAADCHRELDNTSEQVDALGRAAELFANGGAFAKAIALCKVILGVDPGHTRTQARLAELNGAHTQMRPEPVRPQGLPRRPLPAQRVQAPVPASASLPAGAAAAPAPVISVPIVAMPGTMPAGSVVLSSVPAGTGPAADGSWARPRRSLEQMLRLRRAELSRAKLPVGTATPPLVDGAAEEHAVSDSMLAPDPLAASDSMLAPDPLAASDSVVASDPASPSIVAPDYSSVADSIVATPDSIVATPDSSVALDSMIPAPDSMIPAPASIAAPDSLPRVSASVLLEPSASIPVLEPCTSEPAPDSGSDTAVTNRVPPPEPEQERALPFLPQGSLNQLVPGSRAIPDQRGFPSGMYHIDLDEVRLAAPPVDPKRLAERALPVTPLFSELGPESLSVLIASAKLLHFEPGDVVYHQNDPSDDLFVVASGVISIATEGENGVEIARLGDNEFFGETALISNELRLSTARAVEPTDVLAIERKTVTELVRKDPRLLKTVLRFLRERLVESLLLTNPLFTLLSGGERRLLAKRFEFIEFDRGTQLIRQRNRSPGLFVLLCGTVEVARREGSNVRLLALLHAGGVFGEMSLIGRDPAVADVRSMSRGFALMLPEQEFRRVCEEHPQVLEFVQLLAEARHRQNQAPVQQDSIPVSA